ncbi:MAG: S46 family peptidase [Planctomycetaceae bacterium]|jgi:hypothetical protein|nr:S46 family peptidase [Planctomycetaceae bacterium]
MKKLLPVIFFLSCIFVTLTAVRADEGMWLFDVPPEKQVKEKYGFDITKNDFLSGIQSATCRFAKRGTGSFVSKNGLIATNHHVGARSIHELSTPENNLIEKGFYAQTLKDELQCPGLEVLVLKHSADVTEIINDGVKAEMSAEEAQKIRNAAVAAVEKRAAEKAKEAAEKTGDGNTPLRYEVTPLYQGGKYYLYGYRVYNDIRLVWAPEESIASFGGDPDNYEYPRYCVDCALFRAYENGKPAEMTHYLRWNSKKDSIKEAGVKAADKLVFVSGFPGRTDRAFTKEHLEFQRDVYFPWRLQKLYRREAVYSAFASRSLENARRIGDDLRAVQNYRKRAAGQLQGLQTPSLWKDFPSAEKAGEKSPEAKIKKACDDARKDLFYVYDLYESGEGFNCKTFQIARTLYRAAYELEKPNAERLKEYRDNNLESLKQTLFADTPIYENVEIEKLTDSMTMTMQEKAARGQNADPPKSPREWATELIRGSKVRDVAERKRLFEGGKKAIEESGDIMFKLVKDIEHDSRSSREQYENRVEAPMTAAYAELAKQRFEKWGTDIYPDATFTLRLSYGIVKGYQEDDGTEVAPCTDIAGMFERAALQKNREPFDPPQSWKDAKADLDLSTPFNFVTTNDIVGGNSGSPMVNTSGEIIALAFDGNIYSLSNNFIHTEKQSRCVGVCTSVITEALKNVYHAERIVKELETR